MALEPQEQKLIDDLTARVVELERRPVFIDHLHTGMDATRVQWKDINQKIAVITHTIISTDAATAGNYGVFFTAPWACTLISVRETHQVAGTNGGAVTVDIEKLGSGVALDSGSVMLATAFNLKSTANTPVEGTLTATLANRNLIENSRLALKDTGTLTDVSNVTVTLELQLV